MLIVAALLIPWIAVNLVEYASALLSLR